MHSFSWKSWILSTNIVLLYSLSSIETQVTGMDEPFHKGALRNRSHSSPTKRPSRAGSISGKLPPNISFSSSSSPVSSPPLRRAGASSLLPSTPEASSTSFPSEPVNAPLRSVNSCLTCLGDIIYQWESWQEVLKLMPYDYPKEDQILDRVSSLLSQWTEFCKSDPILVQLMSIKEIKNYISSEYGQLQKFYDQCPKRGIFRRSGSSSTSEKLFSNEQMQSLSFKLSGDWTLNSLVKNHSHVTPQMISEAFSTCSPSSPLPVLGHFGFLETIDEGLESQCSSAFNTPPQSPAVSSFRPRLLSETTLRDTCFGYRDVFNDPINVNNLYQRFVAFLRQIVVLHLLLETDWTALELTLNHFSNDSGFIRRYLLCHDIVCSSSLSSHRPIIVNQPSDAERQEIERQEIERRSCMESYARRLKLFHLADQCSKLSVEDISRLENLFTKYDEIGNSVLLRNLDIEAQQQGEKFSLSGLNLRTESGSKVVLNPATSSLPSEGIKPYQPQLVLDDIEKYVRFCEFEMGDSDSPLSRSFASSKVISSSEKLDLVSPLASVLPTTTSIIPEDLHPVLPATVQPPIYINYHPEENIVLPCLASPSSGVRWSLYLPVLLVFLLGQ